MKKKETDFRHMHPVLVVALDLVMLAAILLSYAYFNHVSPNSPFDNTLSSTLPPVQTKPFPTLSPATNPTPSTNPTPGTTDGPTVTEPIVDNRTPWQIKFEDKFTDTLVVTENSYSSPNVSISIETVSYGEGWNAVTYYIADIYVASPECFRTYTAGNVLEKGSKEFIDKMSKECGALIAVTGDYYSIQNGSFIVRSGVSYTTDKPVCDICVLYPDGSMQALGRNQYKVEDVLARNPTQVWSFGPSLLDENGKAKTTFEVPDTLDNHRQPRTAVGYYEPGHYCFVVVDGRNMGTAVGMHLDALAKLFEDLGCSMAYNLDGGGSAAMTYLGEFYSVPSEERKVSDILVIVEP